MPVPDRQRAAGGLLAVVATEAWRGPVAGFTRDHDLPVSAALFDLCAAYVVDPADAPAEVARRHEGVPGPGWLLPIVLASDDPLWRAGEARRLAESAGLEPWSIDACVAYIELAGTALDGARVPAPIELSLSGIGTLDGLTAGRWALAQTGAPIDSVRHLVEECPPWVAAAGAGMLGLGDGPALIPRAWRTRLYRRARLCRCLADRLVDGASGE